MVPTWVTIQGVVNQSKAKRKGQPAAARTILWERGRGKRSTAAMVPAKTEEGCDSLLSGSLRRGSNRRDSTRGAGILTGGAFGISTGAGETSTPPSIVDWIVPVNCCSTLMSWLLKA